VFGEVLVMKKCKCGAEIWKTNFDGNGDAWIFCVSCGYSKVYARGVENE